MEREESDMVLKCEVCGGELEVDEKLSVGKCKYCESQIVIPKDMEKKGNLYNRAVFLRQNNEFDKAINVYEDILKDNNEEAEAHWGLVLSKYGIEYVDDPRSGEKKPTIHRIQNKSILEDADYQMAVKYADLEAGYQYEKEGKRINQILMRFLEIAQKESPYDVFICYKESDALGSRTEDSVIAQDIYRALEKEGYKVFFARKTLESKIGEEYEPIIYAALNSAKVMLVIGTKVEHYQAVWVKNEWSRFSELKQSDEKKLIIPCYKDISPYELPMEIASYQALDVSKIGFLQDLLDGVAKIVRKSTANNEGHINQNHRDFEVEALLENADLNLNIGNYEAAMEVLMKVTKEFPGDYRGWWKLIVCETRKFKQISRESYSKIMSWYIYVKKLATKEQILSMKEQIKECFKVFAKYDAEEKVSAIQQELLNIDESIQDYKNKIDRVNKELHRSDSGLQKAKAELQEEKEKVSANENVVLSHKKKFWIGLGLTFIPFWIGEILDFIGVISNILGVVLILGCIIGIIMVFRNNALNPNVRYQKKVVSDLKNKVCSLHKKVELATQEQMKVQHNCEETINKYKCEMKQLHEKKHLMESEINQGLQVIGDTIYEDKYAKLI